MKTGKLLFLGPGLVLAFMIAASAASAPKLTFKFTTVRVPGALSTAVGGINNAGVMVGQYQAGKGTTRGFMRDGDKWTRIDHPGGSQTICRNVNSSGAIVGNYVNSKGAVSGFLYEHGKFADIPGPRGAKTAAVNGINDNGLVVGSYGDSKGTGAWIPSSGQEVQDPGRAWRPGDDRYRHQQPGPHRPLLAGQNAKYRILSVQRQDLQDD